MSYVADYNEIVEQLIALGNNEYKPVKRFTDQATAERRLREVGETLEALRAGGATPSDVVAEIGVINDLEVEDANNLNSNSADDDDKTVDEEDDRLDAEEAEELLQVQERERRLKAAEDKKKKKVKAEPEPVKTTKKAKAVKEPKAKTVKKAKAAKEPKPAKKAKAVSKPAKAEPKATAQQSAAEAVLGIKPGTKKSKMLAYLIQHKKVAIPRSKLKAAVFGDEKNCDDSFRLCLGGLSKTMMNKKWGKVTVNHGGKEVSYVFDTTKA